MIICSHERLNWNLFEPNTGDAWWYQKIKCVQKVLWFISSFDLIVQWFSWYNKRHFIFSFIKSYWLLSSLTEEYLDAFSCTVILKSSQGFKGQGQEESACPVCVSCLNHFCRPPNWSGITGIWQASPSKSLFSLPLSQVAFKSSGPYEKKCKTTPPRL